MERALDFQASQALDYQASSQAKPMLDFEVQASLPTLSVCLTLTQILKEIFKSHNFYNLAYLCQMYRQSKVGNKALKSLN